ncbi:hypothetical protein TNCV_517381 [Trichonephila clavipes]|nr:hypothetical protein TNCV_517381 [Trichonephila clavipes]
MRYTRQRNELLSRVVTGYGLFHPGNQSHLNNRHPSLPVEKYPNKPMLRWSRGRVPSTVEMSFLERVRWLDMYGVDLHPVLLRVLVAALWDKKLAFRTRERRKFWVFTDGPQRRGREKDIFGSRAAIEFSFGEGERHAQRRSN